MINGEKLVEDLRAVNVTLAHRSEEAEFEGYKNIADKIDAQRKSLRFAISLIESGKYDIKEKD